MLTLYKYSKISSRLFIKYRNYATIAIGKNQKEAQNAVRYPDIKDVSFKGRKKQKEEKWYKAIQDCPTVEEKIIKINMPRYYGYKVVKLDGKFPYNILPSTQHFTRTVFEQLPVATKNVENSESKSDVFIDAVKNDIVDAVELAHDYLKHNYEHLVKQPEPKQQERDFTQFLLEQINRVIINALSADFPHLHEVEVDYNPRHEAFWFVGGIDPPKVIVKIKKGIDWQKEMANDSVDRAFQYSGVPYLALRHRHQLTPWKSMEETENATLAKSIPRYNFDPRTLGYSNSYEHGKNIPGFWPGSPNKFGCISYQPRDYLLTRHKSYGVDDFKEVLHAQAIQSSFAWLLAQANYFGFNTFNELTYPLNTQTIITNGRLWSFYEYQMNTTLLHTNQIDENCRVNYCRGTNEMQLFEEINESGKCIGFNDDVLNYLLQFYKNAPILKRDIETLTPNLSKEVKNVSDYEDSERRIFLENTFKYISANRPRHLELPEIYLWEKIYKIDHNTRPLDPRRRFFELNINPWKRTLDQHDKVYIPRAVRPGGPKSRNKRKNTYYP